MDIIKLPARTDSPVWPKRKNKISLDQIFFGLLYLLERSVVETRYIFSLFKFKTLGTIIATCLGGVLNNMIKGKAYKVYNWKLLLETLLVTCKSSGPQNVFDSGPLQ